jgi:putative Holliday junction resolvase
VFTWPARSLTLAFLPGLTNNYPLTLILVQQKETTNPAELADVFDLPPEGRILAIDPGTKRCGVAICDELRMTARPLAVIKRTSWKKLLSNIKQIVAEFDANALVIGLPLESDGTESEMSAEARSMARKFSLSLQIPVFLQDERVTSYEAKSRLWEQGRTLGETRALVDSEAASIILSDFLDRMKNLSRG